MNNVIDLLAQRPGDRSQQLPCLPPQPLPCRKSSESPWEPELSLSPFSIFPQVYGASNVELITRTRTEHLSEQHKGKVKGKEAEARGGREHLHQHSL